MKPIRELIGTGFLIFCALASLILIVINLIHLSLLHEQTDRIQSQILLTQLEIYKAENPLSDKPIPSAKAESRSMIVTAYCPCQKCCGKWADGMTSTGTNAYSVGVAVDPKVIPLGTRMYIPDYGFCIADDTGSAIKGDKIDVRFNTHSEALQWGRQRKTVSIFRE